LSGTVVFESTAEVLGKSLDYFDVRSYGILSVISTLEFIQHHFS